MAGFFAKLFGSGPKVNYKEIVQNGGLIIDVRTKGEYAGGHVKNSVNIPLDELKNKLKNFKDIEQNIITCCASGMRSASAKNILKSNGFVNVYNGGSWSSLQNKVN